MDFDYFYGRGADQFAFYQIPKILITDEKFAGITMESKILYSLCLQAFLRFRRKNLTS
ncbi:replication initiator protein A [Oribacterium sp. P6A1]|uniref:replication initiator protein A n=1 Tax=Oribacterium sp. P6A1 TaxID=1410612 RepID=UPI0018CC0624|nr:replication initiator protein A [Oribacterium sp. P6A1]